MKLRLIAFVAALAFLGAVVVAPLSASAARPTGAVSAPATGTVTTTAGTLVGNISSVSVVQFVNQNGQLAAVVNLLDSTGATLAQITAPVTASGSCQILDLTLGPLDLDLLGLVVHLDTVHLNITAQSGSGQLLGNLLCAVSHLLDGGGLNVGNALTQIVGLLNQILGAL